MKRIVCIAQIGFRQDVSRNVGTIKRIIEENRSADLIVFPELILHGHPSSERPEGLLDRRVRNFYRSIADDSEDLYRFVRSRGAAVVIGELKGGPWSYRNVATYIDRERIVHYAKTHVHWTENFVPGQDFEVFESSLGMLGMLICYDGAFSEPWRVLALRGAWVIINISATPRSFPDRYVRRRLQGAAISNQLFVVYANRPGSYFSGRSVVIDPRGEVLAEAAEEECVLNCEVDLDEVERWRKEERVFIDRRPLLYREIGRSHRGSSTPGRGSAAVQRKAAEP